MRPDRILILGGTGEAIVLAGELLAEGHDVISSLAGVTENPGLPQGLVRRGGFGGLDGLAHYVKSEGIAAIADATHPFAAQISRHAVEAAKANSIPCLRLERPAWQAQEGDDWIVVGSMSEAVSVLPAGARVMLTIGSKEASLFFARTDICGVARMIETPRNAVPPGWSVLLSRPPFDVEGEDKLLKTHHVTHLVSKNSGGEKTEAKLIAARQAGVQVIMITRPEKPCSPTYCSTRDFVAALRQALLP